MIQDVLLEIFDKFDLSVTACMRSYVCVCFIVKEVTTINYAQECVTYFVLVPILNVLGALETIEI